MFGRRPDATLVRDCGAMRRFMPYVSPRRNDSVFHLPQDIEVEAALEFIEKRNRERPPERPLTLFHLFMRSLSQAHELRPGVNRFVKGGKLWQRDGIWLSFSAIREIKDGSPMITIKRRFEPATESLDEMVDGIYGCIRPAKAGRKSTSDKEMGLLLRLPGFGIRAALAVVGLADRFGVLPRAMIEADPLFASTFVANLGSVGHDAHGDRAVLVLQTVVRLVLDRGPRLFLRQILVEPSALDHESRHDPVEDRSVVLAGIRVAQKVLDRDRRLVFIQLDPDLAHIRLHHHHRVDGLGLLLGRCRSDGQRGQQDQERANQRSLHLVNLPSNRPV